MYHLAHDGPPAQLLVDDFKAEMAKLKELNATLRKEDAEQGGPQPGTLQEEREVLRVLKGKVAAKYAANSPRIAYAADNYIKALFGLAKLLDTPAVNLLLAGVDKHPEATMGDLLSFMKAYNLRFGVADQPDEQQIYGDLYHQLVALRNEAYPSGSDVPSPVNATQPTAHAQPGANSSPAWTTPTSTRRPPYRRRLPQPPAAPAPAN